ncbi:hypothetical protein KO481_21025 [Nocardia sp. NEAU-G5]|uniref:Uncharacterized protein n=1 Tax=Nocardia albiluteola TaxID=2842303 RepID=A0ABS6B138_9NOCA|nr:hypothetical protein [Nocardia albiluteola]MBU3064002.1 hypothetical protein [Nocardia albiluteola]
MTEAEHNHEAVPDDTVPEEMPDETVSDEEVHFETNNIVFQYGEDDRVVQIPVPALAEDGYRQAWRGVFRQYRMPAESVTAIMSEWEPTPTDEAFTQRNFPNLLERRAVFSRPEPEGWPEAIAGARRLREAVARAQEQQELENRVEEMKNDIAAAPERIGLPLLRTGSEPPELLASHALIPGGLYVVVAGVAPTPRGTLNMQWILRNQLEEKNIAFETVLAEAGENLKRGLRMVLRGDGLEGSDGRILHVEGVDATHMPAAAVSLPDFTERVIDILDGDRFVAGFPCEDHLFVARADTPSAAKVSEMVSAPHECGSDVTPTVLLLEPDGMRVLEQFPR